MRIRHRIPSIFNLSMVDVLCCALGCVILLWLVNLREAKQRAAAAGLAAEQLNQTQARLSDTDQRLRATEQQLTATTVSHRTTAKDRDIASNRARTLEKERDQLDKDLSAARGRL